MAVFLALFPGLFLWTPAYSNPSGGVVVHGDVQFSGSGRNLQIRQNSRNAIINWEDFSIDSGELTQFRQPNSNAAVLNRVTGGNPTAIHGALRANGNVFVINPNGILVGAGGAIDVHGLVLSTLDVSNGEFLAGGDMVFQGNSDAGVTNMGRINGIGGDVFLIGKTVTNSGDITASGTVGLGAGEEVLLTAAENANGERMFVRSTGSGVSGTGVLNDGTIEGAAVELKAHGNIYALAINNKGSIRATGASNTNGRVFLEGIGGQVENSGDISATAPDFSGSASVLIEAAYAKVGGSISATNGDGPGGSVRVSGSDFSAVTGNLDVSGSNGVGGNLVVEGDSVTIGSSASLNASGTTGGGDIRIGGGFQGNDGSVVNAINTVVESGAQISVDSTISGNAGTAIVWADGATLFEGEVSASALGGSGDGGFVEVSGKNVLTYAGLVDTLAANGQAGTLLLDPSDFRIENGGTGAATANSIRAVDLAAQLNLGNVVIRTTGAGAGVHGDIPDGNIRVDQGANVLWGSANSLTLAAYQDVDIRASIQNAGDGNVNVAAGVDDAVAFNNTDLTGVMGSSANYGQRSGTIYIGERITNPGGGNDVEAGAVVGSRFGDTNMVAYGMELVGGDNWGDTAQIGFHDQGDSATVETDNIMRLENPLTDANLTDSDYTSGTAWWGAGPALAGRGNGTTGDITIELKNELLMTKRGNGSNGRVGIQIGHGGKNEDGGTHGGNLGGDITIRTGMFGEGTGNISLDVPEASTVSTQDFVMIGHGGSNNDGNHFGNISIDTSAGTVGNISLKAGDGFQQTAQIGHGGYNHNGTLGLDGVGADRGDITIHAGGTFAGLAGGTDPNRTGTWGGNPYVRASERNYVMLGHGGYNADGAKSGNITLNTGLTAGADGSIQFTSGDTFDSFAQLGHGGRSSDGNITGTITVNATNGAIDFDARGNGAASLNNSHRNDTYVQLGHGGTNARGDHSGAISVLGGGDLTFRSGNLVNSGNGQLDERAYAQLGHGGVDAKQNATTVGNSGAITVDVDGAISFLAGDSRLAYVQLGHGGYDTDNNHDGTIDIDAGGAITFSSGLGANARSFRSFSHLGHGGYGATGAHSGDISVTTSAGGLSFTGGDKAATYTMLGHGGESARSLNANIGHSGNIDISVVGDIDVIAGTMSERTVANGFIDGSPYANLPDDANSANGDEGIYADGRIFAQIGHGGYNSDASSNDTYIAGNGHSGDIRIVSSDGDISVLAGNTANGSAGADEGRFHYAMVGHGGIFANGDQNGAISIEATNGKVTVEGGADTDDGDINNSTGAFNNRTDVYNFSMIGHGGSANAWGTVGGNLSGDSVVSGLGLTDGISVSAGGDITVEAGAGRRGSAQIGMGGYNVRGTADSDIQVTSGGRLLVAGGGGTAGWGQAEGDSGIESYGMIGNGGREADDGAKTGDIIVRVTNQVELFGGDNAYRNYAQIGHGGERSNAEHSGLISVTAGSGKSILRGGQGANGDESYAQVGHGGRAASGGNKFGNVEFIVGGDLDMQSGANGAGGDAFTLIGHGGTGLAGTDEVSGNITVYVDGELSLSRGDAQNQIAHRGGVLTRQAGGVQSDLTVVAGSIDTNLNGTDDLIVINDSTANSQIRNVWLLPYLSNDLGDVTFGTSGSGSVHVAQDFNYNSTSNLTFVSGTNFHTTEQIQNEDAGSTGNVTVVAGWDGTTGKHTLDFTDLADFEIVEGDFNVAPIRADGVANGAAATAFGNNNGVVVVGQAPDGTRQNDRTAVGSAQGETTVLGKDVLVAAGRNDPSARWSAAAQIGVRDYTQGYDITGDIFVQATQDVSVLGADQIAGPNNAGTEEGFAMIGHGGVNENARARDEISGDIYVDAGRNVTVASGTNRRAFTQIGHGGITGYNASQELQRIGGEITVQARTGNIVFTAGTGHESYSLLGHGGQGVNPETMDAANGPSSDISVLAGGDITFRGGTGGLDGAERNFAMLGHGGHGVTTRQSGGFYGDIEVEAGRSAAGFTQNGGAISFQAGDTRHNFTMLGHGGYQSRGTHSGDIEVTAQNGIEFLAGTVGTTEGTNEDGNLFAMLGHGGYNSDATNVAVESGDDYVAGKGHSGDIKVTTAGGNISFFAGDTANGSAGNNTGRVHFAQLGHGGTASRGDHFGAIEVTATAGNVDFRGGAATDDAGDTYHHAQLGHGSTLAGGWGTGGKAGDLSADRANLTGTVGAGLGIDNGIAVTAGGNVSFTGGSQQRAYAMLGLGGYDSDGDTSGNIYVDAGGTIKLEGGTGTEAFSQIGNAGYNSAGTHSGHIQVTSAADVDLDAGTGHTTYSKIGHGGRNVTGDQSGDIAVHASTGVTLNSNSGGQWGYTQIGHGGYSSAGSHSGFVTVTNSSSGSIDVIAGTGANDRTAQIGHGGINNGNHALSGSVSVVNLGGGVNVTAGDNSWRGAIIGHGDAQETQTSGARSGGLNVYANGAVTLTDGGGNSGALISHQTNDGIGSVSYAGSGIQANGDSGYSIVSTGGITFGAAQLNDGNVISLSETIGSALAEGDIALASGGATSDLDLGAIDTNGAIAAALSSYNSSNDVVFAAGRNLTVGFGMQNQGDGDIGLIAGWDSNTVGGLTPPQMNALDTEPHFDPASGLTLGKISIPDFGVAIPLPASCAEFGNHGGDIVIGSAAQTTPLRIGSRAGVTSVLGDSVTLNAGSGPGAATQVGFFTDASGAASGAINVGVHGEGLTMNSGTGAGAYTMIGHGGAGAADQAINADITISFCDLSILDMNANGDGAFSQIGHGVEGGSAALAGNISAVGFSNLTMNGGGLGAYAQIGHGGNLSSGSVDNASITLTGASLNGLGGTGDNSYVMVGHGGVNETRNATNDGVRAGFAEATRSGDIDLTLTGHLDLTGGAGQSAFVQIGHGGRRNNAVNGEGHSGDITISSRSFDIFGGAGADSFGMAGHGGFQTTGNHSGDIAVTTTGPNDANGRLRLRPDTGGNDDADRAFTQIGHGGYDADFDTASDFTQDRYVDNRASTLSGDITLNVAENVVVVGVSSNAAGEAYSQIGHGGFDTTGSFGAAGDIIEVTAGNAITVQGGQVAPTADTEGRGNYAQIGHGGAVNIATGTAPHEGSADPNLNVAADGSHTSTIIVNARSVNVDAGIDNESYAQIGHGGINSGNGGAHTGDISVTTTTGNIRLQGGPGGGFAAHAMIGHGGLNVDGNHNGNITLNSAQDVFLDNSASNNSWTLVGHGGFNSAGNMGTATQNINVTAARNVVLEAGPTNSFAMIGLGGRNSDGDHAINNLNVTATSGYVSLIGTRNGGNEAFTQIGLGGHSSDGTKTANAITVTANGADGNGNGVSLEAGNSDRRYSMIGNGGVASYGSSFTGDVSVISHAGSVLVEASDLSNQSFAMIGHGGRFDRGVGIYEVGNMAGNVTVSALGADSDITVDGGGGTSYAQIGLGGFQAGFAASALGSSTFNGAVDLDAGRDVILQGGSVVSPANGSGFAFVGNGGMQSDAVKTGTITVDAGRNITLTGGGTQTDTARVDQFAQIGHGGRSGTGEINGTIAINQNGGAGAGFVSLDGGDSDRSYAQIGHGGHTYTGDIGQTAGAITLTAAGSIDVIGGRDQEAYAQIGHGGDSADASGAGFNGAVSVTSSAGNVSIHSNPTGVTFANRASGRIGHGGLNNNDATGDFTGDISVEATAGSVTLNAGGEANNNNAQIGHGGIGASAASTHNGSIDVTAGTTISLIGGQAGAGELRAAQIGHGGENTNGNLAGAIALNAGGDVSLRGGGEVRSSAMVGHGGRNSDGAKDGAVSVTSGGKVTLAAGGADTSFAQIGHGGEDSEGSVGANQIANVTVDAATGVDLAGNQNPGGSSYTQIGHGGLRGGAVGNTIAGAVDVSTDAGDILLSGSRNGTGESYNQIGHGGLASTFDVANQNIDVAATAGAITMSGSASQNHVMIGHGGERSTGDFSGEIGVNAQNRISLTGGRNTDAMTQIGHGGSDRVNGAASTLGGGIHIHSSDGSVSLSTLGSINKGSAVQIGHGGYQAAIATTTITGDICVVAGTTAEVSAAGGGGEGSYAMIGHGGVRLAGDRTGDVVVTTGTNGVGGVTLTGGDATNEFAQIGHGGIDSNGRMSGDVYVIADNGGDVTLQGGTNSSTNYAMIGHGDGEGNTSQGSREGGIHIFGINLTASNGSPTLENVNIYHQTNGGLTAGDYEGGDGFQIIPDADNVAASAKDEIGVMVTGNFGSGDINYIDSTDVDITFDGNGMGDILVNSSDDFFFVTGGDVTFLNSYQNAGTGNVTIVAGWNGDGIRPPATVEYADLGGGMFNYCEPTIREGGVQIDFNDCDTFGNEVDAASNPGRGSIILGAADQDNAVYVGSRLGRTVAAGYAVTLNAGDTDGAATQLGFHNGSVAGATGNMTGAIDVYAKGGGVTLNGGSALNAYAQIGHGGTGATVNTIDAAVTVSFCEPGDVVFNDLIGVPTAGSGSHAYTQIGHGITAMGVTTNGDVLIEGFRNVTMNAGSGDTAFAMIGLGGDDSDGNKDGSVTLTGAAALGDRGDITMNGGSGSDAFAQIGMGGRAVNNNKFGGIDISNVVNIDLNGGSALDTQAHIGHGGNDGSNGPIRGNIDLNLSGNLTLDAGTDNEAFAMVGHGGHSSLNMVMLDGANEADLTINAGGFISLAGTASGTPSTAPDENFAPQAFAQIGHGGRGSRGGDSGATAREFHGDISITADGVDANGNAITLQGGNSNESYAQIGHGGRAARSYGDGTIDIDAAGNVELEGGGRSRAYVMIGHGGDDAEKFNNFIGNSNGTNTLGTLMGNQGTIDITTTNGGNLIVTGSQAPTGTGIDHNDSGAQIGHGGHSTFGNHNGDIVLGIDGDVTLTGGLNTDTNGDDRNFAMIGHGGENGDGKLGGTISVTSGGSITGTAGNGGVNFVQIGHGGRNTDGEDDGSGTRILTEASAAIAIVAENNIQFDRGLGNDPDTYAMIGHGGTTSRGTKAGAISVTSHTGDILFGTDTTRTGRNEVRIGHGGRGGSGDTSGNITVQALDAANGNIRFHGVVSTGNANHREGYAQLGHGGRDNAGNHGLAADVIDVDAGGVIEFLAGTSVTAGQGTQGREAYAQLGNGGYQSDGDHAGTINVDAVSDITFDTRGASGDRSYVQLGHGGFSSNGSFSGDINVNQNVAGGAITFLAGRSASFAQLGHGGRNDAGSTRDNSGADGIANTADDVRIESSARFKPGTITGNISVGASDDITFTGGFQAGGTGYAQIGHGGYQQMAAADEGHSGTIEVITSGGAINFTGGTRNAQHAMIGHGGYQALGNHSGAITVEAASGITFAAGGETIAGSNIASFAQIGHGGFDSDFDAGRTIGDFGVVNGVGGFNDDTPLTAPGTMSGAISITTTGAGADIVLTGSQGDNNTGRVGYAQFGHGGASNSGDREGAITIDSGGAVLLNRGTTDDAYAQVGHGGRSAHGTISNANISVTSANGGKVALQGSGLPATAGTSSRAYAQIGHGGHNADVQADSNVAISSSGGVEILGGGAQEGYAMIGHGGDSSDAQGTGFDGNVSVTATSGDIVLTANAPAGTGGNRTFAKIGHGGYVSAAADYSGDVSATATAGSILGAAGVDGNNNYVQIGHGGVANHATTGHTGIINVLAANDITFTGGIDNAGTAGNDREFAMIGHGGANSDGSHSGAVTVEAGTDGTGSITFQAGDIRGTTEGPFAQIGHGGQSHNGDLGGNISVTAATNISMLGGTATDGAYAQIGHGGRNAKGDRSGTVSATATNGKVDVIAGLNNNNYAQIGHGGHEADFTGTIGGTTLADTVTVTAGTTINVIGAQTDTDVVDGTTNGAAQSYAQIGHGGQYADGNHLAKITVDAGTDLAVSGGLSNQTYAQIGHGGLFNGGGGKGNQAGDVDVDAGGNISVTGGVRERAYAQIGHGGFDHDGTKDGNITVDTTGGSVTVSAGSTFNDAYAQIGHGGGNSSGVIGATSGDVSVNATGNIAVVGNQSGAGTIYSQIGHGGRSSGAVGETAAGQVSVNSSGGNILLTGSNSGSEESHTHVGHGGILSNYNVIDSTIDVDATVGAVTIAGSGAQNSTMIGHGGERAAGSQYGGSIFVDAGNGISLTGGTNTTSSAQIGNGGAETNATLTGSVSLTATGGDITLTGGSNTDAFAQVGHGGRLSKGDKSGAVSVVANAGAVTVQGGSRNQAFAQIGHGGHDSDMNGATGGTTAASTITVSAWNNITVNGASAGTAGANTAPQAYASIGHGGQYTDGNFLGNIAVTSTAGAITVSGGLSNQSNGQIGHGGLQSRGSHNADIEVRAWNDISVLGGGRARSYAQIGHGGESENIGADTGHICVVSADGSVLVTGGTTAGSDDDDANAMIGHGGHGVGATDKDGRITIIAADDLTITGGGVTRGFAQVGHGGENAGGALSGDMDILVGGNLSVVGGSNGTAYALLGHGGDNAASNGARSGTIDINVLGTTALTDSAGPATLGHASSGTGMISAASFNLTTGQLNTTANAAGVSGLIEKMAPAGEFELVVTNGDLNVDGAGAFFSSNTAVDLAASGGITFAASVLNGGGGDLTAVAGWDGSTGLVSTIDFNSCEPITQLSIDVGQVLAEPNSFGNNSEEVVVGNGNQTIPLAVGSAGGETNLAGYGVEVVGSSSTAGALAQIGFNEEVFSSETGNNGVASTGDINILAKEGGLTIEAGSQANASAQVGHGGNGTIASLSGNISVDLTHGAEDGDLALAGGGAGGTDAFARLGHGGNSSIGAKNGNIEVAAGEVSLRGGFGDFASATIGHGGDGSVGDLSGAINVDATDEGLVMRAGDGTASGTQIGHGGVNHNGSSVAQPISIASAGAVTMTGGNGLNSASQIGHGGVNADSNSSELSGPIDVSAVGDIEMISGTGIGSFSQIGNGGSSADGDFGGDVTVDSGSNITMTSQGASAAYVKIGHGDDLDSSLAAVSGTGDREGDIEVSADENITMTGAMIGHVNSTSNATATGGTTQVGAARIDPANPAAGSIVADADSEFEGADELRFYVPRRANNEVAAGALLNGVSFIGAETDPSETQRIDEYTINILGDRILFPNEHGNVFGTGPAPQNAGNFAFYYDTIVLEDLPPLPPLPPEPPLPPLPLTDGLLSLLFPDDRTTDDWLREQEGLYTGFNPFGIYYEGFDQYGPYGESTFSVQSGNTLEWGGGAGVEEDILERQLRILEEEEEDEESSEGTD